MKMKHSFILVTANAMVCLEILEQQLKSSSSKQDKFQVQIKAIPRKYRWHQ